MYGIFNTYLCSNILNCVNYDIIGRKTTESLKKINRGFIKLKV